jgi:hypothetical protein
MSPLTTFLGRLIGLFLTLVGWVTLIRGLLLLSLSPEAILGLLGTIHFAELFYLYVSISLVIGAYLTYGGFRPVRYLDKSATHSDGF